MAGLFNQPYLKALVDERLVVEVSEFPAVVPYLAVGEMRWVWKPIEDILLIIPCSFFCRARILLTNGRHDGAPKPGEKTQKSATRAPMPEYPSACRLV